MKKILLALLTTLALSTPSLAGEIIPVPPGQVLADTYNGLPVAVILGCDSEDNLISLIDAHPVSFAILQDTGQANGCIITQEPFATAEDVTIEYIYRAWDDIVITTMANDSGQVMWIPFNSFLLVEDEAF